MSDPNSPGRFNEEKATYALRGDDQPDLEAGVAAIRAVAKSLPVRPGVYRMLDARGDVLYVGKARSLKNRVNQYTQVTRQTKRLLRMVSQTRAMQIVTTNSEAEALLLEAQLIKRFRPPYNVLLRDDKSFPFILLREDHGFPRVQLHRGARRHKGQYYGPFASAGSVRATLNALQKLFLLRSCTDSFFANRSRPCLLFQIRRCSAPCVGRIDDDGYAELVQDAKDFLGGRSTKVQQKLGKLMSQASEAMDFELAAIYVTACARSPHPGQPGDPREKLGDADLFARRQGRHDCIRPSSSAAARPGAIAALPAHTDVPEDEVLASFLAQFYARCRRRGPTARFETGFRRPSTRRPAGDDRVPQRGEQARMIRQARRNAEEDLDRRLAETQRATCAGRQLSSCRSRRSGSRSMTTAMSWAPTRSAQWSPPTLRASVNAYRKFNIKRPETAATISHCAGAERRCPPREGGPGPQPRRVA
jgi:excinuclease ABC subunit C